MLAGLAVATASATAASAAITGHYALIKRPSWETPQLNNHPNDSSKILLHHVFWTKFIVEDTRQNLKTSTPIARNLIPKLKRELDAMTEIIRQLKIKEIETVQLNTVFPTKGNRKAVFDSNTKKWRYRAGDSSPDHEYFFTKATEPGILQQQQQHWQQQQQTDC